MSRYSYFAQFVVDNRDVESLVFTVNGEDVCEAVYSELLNLFRDKGVTGVTVTKMRSKSAFSQVLRIKVSRPHGHPIVMPTSTKKRGARE